MHRCIDWRRDWSRDCKAHTIVIVFSVVIAVMLSPITIEVGAFAADTESSIIQNKYSQLIGQQVANNQSSGKQSDGKQSDGKQSDSKQSTKPTIYKSSEVISLMSKTVLDLNQTAITGILETQLVDGNIMKSTYINGKRDGVELIYDSAGTPLSEFNYKRGKLNGFYRAFYSDGSIKVEVNVIYDKRHGPEREYYRDGKLKSLRTFNNGLLSGEVALYSDEFQDKLLQVGEVIDSKFKGKIFTYYSSGALKSVYSYDEDMLNGEAELYNKDSKLETKFHYKDAQLHGDYITYYPSGNIESTVTYTRGVTSSEKMTYSEAGSLKGTVTSDKEHDVEHEFEETIQAEHRDTTLKFDHVDKELYE